MGDYISLYRNDFGIESRFVSIQVRLEIDGVRQVSDYNFEEPYLSPYWRRLNVRTDEKVFLDGQYTELRAVCSTVEGMRYLKAAIAEGMFLIIPINLSAGTTGFDTMLREFSQNRLILYAELIGERINTFWTERFARR